MTKGTQDTPRTVAGEGKFLIASHNDGGTRVYNGRWGSDDHDVVLPAGVEVVLEEGWMNVPSFVRDMQSGIIMLRRDDVVPDAKRPDVDEEYGLTDPQAAIARKICYGNEITPEVKSVISLHKLLGPGGMTPNGVAVTKLYVKTAHAQMLRAAADLEKRLKNRKPVLKLLATTISEIEAI